MIERRISRREVLRIGAGGALAAGGLALGAGRSSAVASENAKPGTFGWLNPALDRQIRTAPRKPASVEGELELLVEGVSTHAGNGVEGYASEQSVNTGSPINLHISSELGDYVVSVLRMGWYDGAGAREVYRSPALTGVEYATPQWDRTGLIECAWPVATTLSTSGWPTGYYLAALIPVSTGLAEHYIPFVVRDDSSSAPILLQVPFTTYQAYNLWGGKSLYLGRDGARGQRVSFDRPYHANAGTMFLLAGDHQLISWLERNNYHVSYAASSDTHVSPNLLANRQVFLSVRHDEYWSQTMRDNLVSWIGAGKSIGFLSTNNVYWRIRFESNTSGAANRVMACFKDAALDPNKTEPSILYSQVGMSEGQILGVDLGGFNEVYGPWIVTDASHWIYAGTGLANGSEIPNLFGKEWDRASEFAPSDTVFISTSHLQGPYGPTVAAAAVREPISGQVIFTAGSQYFPMHFGGYNSPGESAPTAKMLQNFFARVGNPQPPITTVPPPTTKPQQPNRVAAQEAVPTPPAPRVAPPQGSATTPSGRGPASQT